MNKLGVMEEVPVARCWLETTNAAHVGTKWVDMNTGDGCRLMFRSRCAAAELKAHQAKAGIHSDEVFRATPPSEAVGLWMSLTMTERKDSEMLKMIFIDSSRAHFHSSERRHVFVEAAPERARSRWGGLVEKHVRGQRRGGGLRGHGHGCLTKHGIHRRGVLSMSAQAFEEGLRDVFLPLRRLCQSW